MTNEEAKSELMQIYMSLSEEKKKAIDVAIEALEQEPRGDVVSRKVFEQVIWERDVAIAELKELGYRFGEKPPMGIWKVIEQEPQESEVNNG